MTAPLLARFFRPRSSARVLCASTVTFALVLAPLGCARSTGTEPSAGTEAGQRAQLPIQTSSAMTQFEPGGIADVVDRVLPSVVSVASTRTRKQEATPFHHFFGQPPQEQTQQGLGSGVILTADGLVVTNNHVVEEADELTVRTFDDRELTARVVGTDPKSDLAVLQLEGELGKLSPIVVGDSGNLRLGEAVLAVGNPFGVGQTVTMGIVSAKGRADMGIVDYEDFIQTDAAINPGNSGGALVNQRGELIGINTAILSRSGGYMGIGFAIPTNMALPIIEALRTDGKVTRGFLGVSIQDLDQDLVGAIGLPAGTDGILLSDVQAGGPAARAGLASGDVVTAVGGTPVASTGKFRNLIASSGAGKKVSLTVLKAAPGKPGTSRKSVTVDVELGTLEEDSGKAEGPIEEKAQDPEVDGLSFRDLDPQLRRRLSVPDDVAGAVVVRIQPGSRAARAKLRPGDVILEVNQKPVLSGDEAKKAYAAAAGAKLLLVYRQGARTYVVVK